MKGLEAINVVCPFFLISGGSSIDFLIELKLLAYLLPFSLSTWNYINLFTLITLKVFGMTFLQHLHL